MMDSPKGNLNEIMVSYLTLVRATTIFAHRAWGSEE